jgi:type III restriction enzyme
VDHLIIGRGISLPDIVSARFRLRDIATRKIDQYRIQAFAESYQRMLLPDAATPLDVSPDLCFNFPGDNYPANRFYQGSLKFQNHFYEHPADMNEEEAPCAVVIDTLPQVRYWVRNLERRPDCAFWLQTSTDKFYPDFVALLKDGRYLVVEYKGADRMDSPDTGEKKILGELWEARSKGHCIFTLVGRDNMEQSLRKALA